MLCCFSDHWWLMAVDPARQQIIHLDSLGPSPDLRHDEAVAKLKYVSILSLVIMEYWSLFPQTYAECICNVILKSIEINFANCANCFIFIAYCTCKCTQRGSATVTFAPKKTCHFQVISACVISISIERKRDCKYLYITVMGCTNSIYFTD